MKITIAQIVLENAAFAHREDYLALPHNAPIESSPVELSAEVGHSQGDPIKMMVRLRAASEGTYKFAVSYVAYVSVESEEGEEPPDMLDRRVLITGCYMLFPFIRETVASLSGRGRFGPSWLSPTNFNELFKPETAETVQANSGE
jgi:preprotein translocase subunit SecB